MKKFLLPFFLFTPLLLSAQPADSAAVARQVDSLVQIAAPLIGQRKFDEAQPTLEAAKKLALDKFGASHPAYASCLFQQARIFHNSNKYADAERLYLEVKSIREKTLGKDHLDYAGVLNNLGMLYLSMSRFDEAGQAHLEAKAIREKRLGKDNADYINSVNNLGSVYLRSGRFEEAETAYLEVKAFREKRFGKKDVEYARVLSNLANLCNALGRYEEAERNYIVVKGIQAATLGKESYDYGRTLRFQGLMCKDLGRFEEAETCFRDSRAVLEKARGNGDPEYANATNDLASLYYLLGQYDAAEPLYREAQAIREKLLGQEHPDYAAVLNNRAVLYMATGQFKTAEPLYLEAKGIFEKKQEKESPKYAWSLNNLALLYEDMGRFGAADSLLLQARTIREKALGKDHPDYANTLEDLAILYEKTGKQQAAIPLQMEAKSIFEKTLGKSHPEYAKSLNSLGRLHVSLGKPEAAEPFFMEANAVQRSLLVKSARHLSEREMAAYGNLFVNDLDGFYSFAKSRPAPDAALTAACFDNALFYKGFLLNAASRLRNMALADSVSAKRLELLAASHRCLAAEYAKPAGERKDVAVLEQKAKEQEKELMRNVAGYGDAIRQVSWKEVQAKLQPGEAAVEFIHFHLVAAKPTDSILYAALVLQAGSEPPRFVPLFEQKSLDSLLRASGSRSADYVKGLYNYSGRGVSPLEKPRKTLYELIWQPLENTLAGVQTVYFSPSGLLHRLNLGAIPVKFRTTLADRFRLVELGSTRLLAVPPAASPQGGKSLLIGGVQYEMDSLAIAQANDVFSPDLIATRRNLGFSADSTLRSGKDGWRFLEGTEYEVNSIEGILGQNGIQATVRQGFSATEEAFKSIANSQPSPRVLHLATHGFFSPDPTPQPPKGGVSAGSPSGAGGGPVFQRSEHPMIRSGLLLAGANYAWQTGNALQPGAEDGILTAYEISQMNLLNTELVVLSACETGLGDIQGNEGVYGLQRAFKIAGAKYLIMSLWEVSDEKTPYLMEAFYKKWLAEKMPVPDAFRAAQKQLREAGYEAYDWAGFVLVE